MADLERDFWAWLDLAGSIGEHTVVVGAAVVAVLNRAKIGRAITTGRVWLHDVSASLRERATAERRSADIAEAALILNATEVAVPAGEDPITTARGIRPHIAWAAYQEWRGEGAHLAAGDAAAIAHPNYGAWLRRALHYLDIVLIEAARTNAAGQWQSRVREELAPHRAALQQVDVNEFQNGPLREIIRGR